MSKMGATTPRHVVTRISSWMWRSEFFLRNTGYLDIRFIFLSVDGFSLAKSQPDKPSPFLDLYKFLQPVPHASSLVYNSLVTLSLLSIPAPYFFTFFFYLMPCAIHWLFPKHLSSLAGWTAGSLKAGDSEVSSRSMHHLTQWDCITSVIQALNKHSTELSK